MSTAPPYQLSIDGLSHDLLRVHSFRGKEAASEAWSFEVVATADAAEPIERSALGQRAVLLFNVGEQQRAFYGVVAAVRVVQAHHADHTIKYHVRVVPRLWLLRRKRRTRIFQNMRVTDIVTAVLNEAGIATRWQLTRAYPMREYCTQYEETDYRFVQRLLAEAGIFFYFPTGAALDDAALAADTALGVAAAAGSSVVGAIAGAGVGSLVGAAATIAETLIPGDTVICADDAACYPPVGADDAAALAASTAAALAPAVADMLGGGAGAVGAAVGAASAVAGTVIASVVDAAADVPTLHFLANEEARVSLLDKVTRFALRNTVRSTGASFRDYDPERPLVRLQSAAVSTVPFPPSALETAAMAAAAAENAASAVESLVPLPGAVTSAIGAVESFATAAGAVVSTVAEAMGQRVPHEVYEHHSPFLFPKWSFAAEEAPRILRQKRRRASMVAAEGGCPDLSPGHRFALRDHPVPQIDGTYVVTSIEHRGQSHPEHGREQEWRVYWNAFECAPAEVTFVPSRPKRQSVQVTLTATVVGPPGEEIWVDRMGQIKVQFHWDRDGKHDDKSSCWIRVMQPWAGAGWGHHFFPRVGMEVVVTFEGGDPDKPIVLGTLYNGTHPPVFKLPDDKTRSGIRTQTTPGGHGSNELSFQDARGREQVYIHAERDMQEVVKHDHVTKVHRHQEHHVGGTQHETIVHDQHLAVGGNRSEKVGVDMTSSVGSHRTTKVGGDDKLSVTGSYSAMVSEHFGIDVKGNYSVMIGSDGDPRQSDHYVNGSCSIGAADRLVLRAEKGLVLQCGETKIELSPEALTLLAKSVEVMGGAISMSGSGPSLEMGKTVQLFAKAINLYSEKGGLELGKNASLKGEKLFLNCDLGDPSLSGGDGKTETQPFSCAFSDYNLKPYADKTYHLRAEGLKIEGKTDGDGVVSAKVPKDAKQITVTIWIDEYPTGRRRTYVLNNAKIPAASSPEGAMFRLKHLGYFRDKPGAEITPAAEAAIIWFQDDHKDTHGLEPNGKLDGPTASALQDVYGS